MRSRLVPLLTVITALAAVVFAIPRIFAAPSRPPPAHATLPPALSSYLGVFEEGAPPSYEPLDGFAMAAGRRPNLVGYFSGWAQPFDTSFAELVSKHDGILFVQIDPTLASVAAIAAGSYDMYLRSYAASVRAYGKPVVIGFGHEMNGNWYAWSHVQPSVFVAAWKHIVTLFRKEGAENVTWIWTINAAGRPGIRPPVLWWPGDSYVTWVGIDGFYYRSSDTFRNIFAATIKEVRSFTARPVLLSETGVGPAAGQFGKILNLFNGMTKFRTLGLVWFDKKQHAGLYHQDWRIEDDQGALAAFRLGVKDQLSPATAPR